MDQPGMPPLVRPKIGRNVLTCGGMAVGSLLIVSMLVAYLLNETGLVRVPGLSWAYEGPVPTRRVSVEPLGMDRLRALLTERLQDAARRSPTGPYIARIDEGELTGALTEGIKVAMRDKGWRSEGVQAVVRPDAFELFGHVGRNPLRVEFLATFTPVLEGDGLRFIPTSARIGDFRLSSSFADMVMGFIFSRDFGTWTVRFGAGTLRDIRLGDGYLDIVTGMST